MATTTATNSGFELDYSPTSQSSSLKQKSTANIATAMVISPNLNYHYINNVNNSSHNNNITNNSNINNNSTELGNNDSGFELSGNTSTNLNNISNPMSLLNISPLSNKDLIQANFGFNTTGNFGYSASLMTSAQLTAGLENKCLRCSNQVYALERIGPIKGNIYHKTCFKCLICERQLDLKTYYTNQIDLNDRQIYCQSHAPKCGKGIFGADSIYIHNVLNAPKLDVMQKVDNKPKVNHCLIQV